MLPDRPSIRGSYRYVAQHALRRPSFVILRSSRLSGVTEGLAFRPKHVSCATNRRSQVLADQWPR